MRAHQFITEKAVKKVEFARLASDPTIRMGFECEMLLRETGGMEMTLDVDNAKWSVLSEYLTAGADEEDYDPDNDDGEAPNIYADYAAWVEGLRDMEFAAQERRIVAAFSKREGVRASEAAADARADWMEHHPLESVAQRHPMDEFIKDRFKSNGVMIAHYDMLPIFGWSATPGRINTTDDEDLIVETAFYHASDSLRRELGVEVDIFSTYHEDTKNTDRWYIEPDTSIVGDGVGAEIVSQPYAPPSEALAKMQRLFHWMQAHHAGTNESTSVHLNMSIKGKTEDDYDFLKMMLFFDENAVAKEFGRLGNKYCDTIRQRLRNVVATASERLPDANGPEVITTRNIGEATEILRQIGKRIETAFGRYSSISPRGNGVFEFRLIGGAGYQKRFEIINKRAINMASILKIGSDPDLYAREYVTKIVQMLDVHKYRDSEPGSGHLGSAVGNDLAPLFPVIVRQPSLIRIAQDDPVRFVVMIAPAAKTARQSQALRRYAVNHGVTPASIWGYLSYMDDEARRNTYQDIADAVGFKDRKA